ncbi:MAG: hypothetical protein AAGL17_20110, partial [Cyanobacteria bacterium J06576_12]
MSRNDDGAAWHVAVNDAEQVVGFQWIAPGADYLPPEATEIATQTAQNSTELTQSIQAVLSTAEVLQTSTGQFKVQ